MTNVSTDEREVLPRGSYAGIVECEPIVVEGLVIGGAAVACPCGAGGWYPSKFLASRACVEHEALSKGN